jgi:RNA polymerase sigma-70 factor (ECF subfamily)
VNPVAQDHPAHRPLPDRDRDLALARAAGAGDGEACRLVARRLFGRVRTTVRYLCGDSPEQLDLAQECLMEVLGAIADFRGESRLETWADRIVVRTALHLLRQERRRARGIAVEAGDLPAPETPESDLQQARIRARVAVLYQKLSPERRTVVVLQVVHGYTLPEIAALTETGLETVRSRFKLARKQLRRLVAADPDLREWSREAAP